MVERTQELPLQPCPCPCGDGVVVVERENVENTVRGEREKATAAPTTPYFLSYLDELALCWPKRSAYIF